MSMKIGFAVAFPTVTHHPVAAVEFFSEATAGADEEAQDIHEHAIDMEINEHVLMNSME